MRAANYPLTDEDLESDRLPPRLRNYRRKLFGLTIDPDRLQQIRQERRPNSRYANLDTCKREVAAAETMFRMERIPTLSTTHTSIEEISSKVLATLGLQRAVLILSGAPGCARGAEPTLGWATGFWPKRSRAWARPCRGSSSSGWLWLEAPPR